MESSQKVREKKGLLTDMKDMIADPGLTLFVLLIFLVFILFIVYPFLKLALLPGAEDWTR